MFIKQLSVFLENNPGTLRAMTELLGKDGIDLLALSIADTQSFGIVRTIIHSGQVDRALNLLEPKMRDKVRASVFKHILLSTIQKGR